MVELCEALNVYTDGQKTYHRVTSIIRDCYGDGYDGIREDVLDNAAERGRETEVLCAEYLLSGGIEGECREDVVPRLEAFERFVKKHDVEYVGHQITTFSDEQQTAGTIDFFLNVDGLLTITDLKCCAAKMKTWAIQVGGYASMKRADQAGILQLYPSLNKQGFRWYPYDVQQVKGYWQTCYAFWKMNREL